MGLIPTLTLRKTSRRIREILGVDPDELVDDTLVRLVDRYENVRDRVEELEILTSKLQDD
jgi:hypothetical protein